MNVTVIAIGTEIVIAIAVHEAVMIVTAIEVAVVEAVAVAIVMIVVNVSPDVVIGVNMLVLRVCYWHNSWNIFVCNIEIFVFILGKMYYYNCKTEVSQWEKPKEWIERER